MPLGQSGEAVEPGSLKCAICFTNLEYMAIYQREAHYEHHFVNEASVSEAAGTDRLVLPRRQYLQRFIASKSMSIAVDSFIDIPQISKSPNLKKADSTSLGSGVPGKSPRKWPLKECDVFWHTAQVTTPPSSHTPGMWKRNCIKNNDSSTYDRPHPTPPQRFASRA